MSGFVNVPKDVDPELAKLVQAQLDANRIAQSELNLKRRLEAAQLETISSTESLKQDVRQLIQETRQLLEYMQQAALKDDALQDIFEALSHKIERLESGMMLVLMDKLDSPQVQGKAVTLVNDIGREHRQRLKSQHIKNLSALEERAAKFGAGNIPLDLQNQIDAEREALDNL